MRWLRSNIGINVTNEKQVHPRTETLAVFVQITGPCIALKYIVGKIASQLLLLASQ
uniref:Uncharacterized protein n=1 Tax=Anguilla anguilla TaxID=7936 RepID=A0A0E9SXY2_ANGAN